MDDRKDETQDQHDQPQSQKPSGTGYPEENPSGQSDGGEVSQDEKGTEPTDREHDSGEKPGSTPGAAGEGTQSTGNPLAAG
jgi:hypothetical protein